MVYLELMTGGVQWKDERGEQITIQLVAWRQGNFRDRWKSEPGVIALFSYDQALAIKFISSCETAVCFLTVTVDL